MAGKNLSHPAIKEKSGVIWLTGLSAAGKTTIAKKLAILLKLQGHDIEELDGDLVRSLFPATGFSRTERNLHIQRMGFLASRLEAHRVIVIASFISPYEEGRSFVKNICSNYFEVYVSTPLDVCEQRDPKGLYQKARAGLLQSFTGVDDPYEAPLTPDFTADTVLYTADEIASQIASAYLAKNSLP